MTKRRSNAEKKRRKRKRIDGRKWEKGTKRRSNARRRRERERIKMQRERVKKRIKMRKEGSEGCKEEEDREEG